MSQAGSALVLVSQLVVEVLADLLQDGRRYLWELHLAQLRLGKVTWQRSAWDFQS